MKDYFCDCSHGAVSLWYFYRTRRFLKQSSMCFVISVGKLNILLGIWIIYVKPCIF